jgi:hypothetical protein
MTDPPSSPRTSNRTAHSLELIIMLILGLVTLPVYAIAAVATWFISGGQDLLGGWQLVAAIAVFWPAENLLVMALLWSNQQRRRESPSFRRCATAAAQVGASTLAWWVVGSFVARAAAAGFIAGVVYALLAWVHHAVGARERSDDPAEREAQNEAAIRSLLFPDTKQHDDT